MSFCGIFKVFDESIGKWIDIQPIDIHLGRRVWFWNEMYPIESGTHFDGVLRSFPLRHKNASIDWSTFELNHFSLEENKKRVFQIKFIDWKWFSAELPTAFEWNVVSSRRSTFIFVVWIEMRIEFVSHFPFSNPNQMDNPFELIIIRKLSQFYNLRAIRHGLPNV